ncbi:pyruvate, water dikinase [Klenkia soli]|uniref:Phosphoenolpyruvate synthase n=1 Tax=Klenkia soli TaxID=1052260 RepID=A0A1H0FX70_9ACTN|nr:PEP/pyruvate-binding domain-containing protein [Klenkia soli]SDN99210.1 pyruvate, water dikinase [Klenkia soli]
MPRPPSPYVQFFDDPTEPVLELLGGKCASLVSMTAAGMPVPPGFAVTTAAYDTFLDRSGIGAEIRTRLAGLDPADVRSVDEASTAIQELVCTTPVPDDVRADVQAAFEQLQAAFAEPVAVAVRSSATAEDLPGASFAGQQDTYLWLHGFDAVGQHIRSCWGSLYTSRAILYRLRNGIADDGLSMAVAVQKMVNARAAGVAITMNPTTGDRSKITIDASWGVGEMVVSGQVTPDNLLVDKVMLSIVSETVGAKHAELVPDTDGRRLVERDVDPDRRARRCLTDAEVLAVAAMAKRAERHYRCPQDVEWALDADLPAGQDLLLLQSRPETVHSNAAPTRPAPAAPAAAPTAINLSAITAGFTTRSAS